MLEIIWNTFYIIYFICACYVLATFYIILQFVQQHNKPTRLCNSTGNLVALVTGGAKGIGLETSRQLLNMEITVVVVGIYKSQRKGLTELKNTYKEKVIFLDCDLSSLNSVKQLVTNFEKLQLPLHILINNAGIMFSSYAETEDHHESQWGINFLSHFYLTHLLFNHLKQSSSSLDPVRVVNLASCVHYLGTINFEDIESRKCYSAEAAYCQSKLAMVMFSHKLDRELRSANVPIVVNSVHPAVAVTNLYKNVWWFSKISWIVQLFLKTPSQGSDTVIHAALSEDVVEGGNYFENCRKVKSSKIAQCLKTQDKLWKLALSQLEIKEFGKI